MSLHSYCIHEHILIIQHIGLLSQKQLKQVARTIGEAIDADCDMVIIDLTEMMCPDEQMCKEYAEHALDHSFNQHQLERIIFVLPDRHSLRTTIREHQMMNYTDHKLLFAPTLEDALLCQSAIS